MIDNRYKIIKRFGDASDIFKQVYLVKDKKCKFYKKLEVLKLYTPQEQDAFVAEVERNRRLLETPRLVKMTDFVGAYQGMPHLTVNDITLDTYSYIVLPYCPKGSLLELVMKANDKNHKLSPQL